MCLFVSESYNSSINNRNLELKLSLLCIKPLYLNKRWVSLRCSVVVMRLDASVAALGNDFMKGWYAPSCIDLHHTAIEHALGHALHWHSMSRIKLCRTAVI